MKFYIADAIGDYAVVEWYKPPFYGGNTICKVSDAMEPYTGFKFIQKNSVFLLSQYYTCSQER